MVVFFLLFLLLVVVVHSLLCRKKYPKPKRLVVPAEMYSGGTLRTGFTRPTEKPAPAFLAGGSGFGMEEIELEDEEDDEGGGGTRLGFGVDLL